MKFTALLKLFVLRYVAAERVLTGLSIAGVALGVALFVGVKVSSDRALAAFGSDVESLNPSAGYEVLDRSGIDFDERVYPAVRHAAERSFPVLAVTVFLPELRETLDLRGIDVVRAASFLRSSGAGYGPGKADVFTDLDGIIVTRRFSEAHHLGKGDLVPVLAYDKTYRLKIVDIMDAGPLFEDTAIMDIGNFQEFFGKTGYLSRIEVNADSGEAAEAAKVLPSPLSIEKTEELVRNRKDLLISFRYNLQFVSLIAVLVGVFLLYNTIFISLVKRRTEIGILRGLGAGKTTVVMLFLCQGLFLGCAGSVLGILLGQGVAYASASAVQKTITAIYKPISPTDYALSGTDAVVALALGVLVSLAASAVPAWEASRIRPVESLKEGAFEFRYKGYYKPLSWAGVVVVALGAGLAALDYLYLPFGFPFAAYAGILLIIAGFALVSPLYLSAAAGLSRGCMARVFGAVGAITSGEVRGNTYRFSVALMSVAVSTALIIALMTLIYSFRSSLLTWIDRNIAADVYIKPSACRSNFCFYPLSEEMVKAVKETQGVAALDRFRSLHIDFRGQKIVVGFGDTTVQREYSGRRSAAAERQETGTDKEAGISNYLSVRYGLKKGDFIDLPTPKGEERFRISSTFSSYSTTSGFVYMDRRWLKEYWGLDDATQLGIYVKRGTDVNAVIRDLKARLLPRYAVEVMNNRELRTHVLDIFDRTFAITYAIELVAIVVSLIGVVNTLLALVLERKRDISIMRYLGGSWKQIRDSIVVSAGLVGLTGISLGAVMGGLLSVVFIEVVNRVSFGWEIRYSIPWGRTALVAAGLFLATVAAGLLPARVARAVDPRRFISFE